MKLLDIISGKDRRISAHLARLALGCLTPIYRAVIFWRNWRFDTALRHQNTERIKKAEIPVISVGNLTTGGTGKTPHVVALAQQLRTRQIRVALISRGYGADPEQGSRNDEAMELEIRLPDVPHLQDPDRFAMSQIAVDELESEAILLDDGFQHRQLHRDLDIVVVDATLPFGYGRLLPRGLLREPISSLCRADWVILSRSDLISIPAKQSLLERLTQHVAADRILETKMRSTKGVTASGDVISMEALQGKKSFAACGIGNPENFLTTLENAGIDVVSSKFFPDHYGYQRTDIDHLAQLANRAGCEQILCTQKDLVKLAVDRIGNLPLVALSIDVEFENDPQVFFEELFRIASGVAKAGSAGSLLRSS